MRSALFVTWDGPGTNYLDGLFLPIFAGLREHGVAVSVLQFTWGDAAPQAPGVQVVRVPRAGAVGQAWLLARGPAYVARAAQRVGADVLYPRSLLPLAICMRARKPGMQLVFDADGLVADERAEFAGWSTAGPAYRWYRDLEAQGIRNADAVITRTARAREILLARGGAGVPPERVVAIPNGKNERSFFPGSPAERAMFRAAHGIPTAAPWLVYAGSIGPQYHLAEMLDLHARVRDLHPDARLTLLTGATLQGGPGVDVRRVSPVDVPRWLQSADVGLSLRTPSFSQRGVSPIKAGEYQLCGLPVVATRVGDLEDQLGASLFLDDVGSASLDRAAAWISRDVMPHRDALREEAREAGLATFGLTRVVGEYARVFAGLPS